MIAEKIQLESDEHILLQVRKHWFVLCAQMIGVIIVALLPLFFSYSFHELRLSLHTSPSILHSSSHSTQDGSYSSGWLFLVFGQTTNYRVRMIWQLIGDAAAIGLVEFATASSNDPALGYLATELASHRKYSYGTSIPIWQTKMNEQVEWVGSFSASSKFGPYLTLSSSSANAKCIVEITRLF
jgi:hypothetical protein